MNISIQKIYSNEKKTEQLSNAVLKPQNKILLNGVTGSLLSFIITAVYKKANQPFLLVFTQKEDAAYYLNDLENLLNKEDVLFYPASYRRPYQIDETDNANILLRAEALNRINTKNKPLIIVSYTEALFEKVVTKKELEKNTLKINVNDKISLDFLNETLFEYQFTRVDFVSQPGEFSVRGGIIDVFSFSNDSPYRIEFFGNEVDSIRTFDVETQLSLEKQRKITIIPNFENKFFQEKRQNFLDYISKDTVLLLQDTETSINQIKTLFEKANLAFNKLSKEIKHSLPEDLFLKDKEFLEAINNFTAVTLKAYQNFKNTESFSFKTSAQPSFNKQFDLLLNNLNQNHYNGYTNFLCCSSESQAQRFHDIFQEIDEENHENIRKQYKTVVLPLYQGFIDEENLVVCYTDHQIFERYHKFSLKSGLLIKQNLSLKELNSLSIGDYVTHIDHGIGKFGGLQKIEVEGKTQEAIKLIYAENDILYVSIHSLHKISKYNGKDGAPPKIFKLGSNSWKVLKQKTKSRVKELAFNLIQVYAKRKAENGYQYLPDSYLQKELESSFIYEDTPDQIKATADVKADMESNKPMDRLVCGDVGFGKTEVAIRAAFKAVDNNKQVAVLVPTTILAYQHFRTFTERLKNMPVTVNYLNRFRTAKQKSETLKKLAEGKVDIIIGTHQLVNKDIKFKDLGLLIIDEEQKFGVNVKDKLKTISTNIDTLTLTATPIPRTLQFSLMAARDLSVINTPPPNRYPIETQVIRFSEEKIRDAIIYEMQRGGQVFFIHNRIENIKEVVGLLQRLVPNAKIGIGHGQMEGKKLEEIMLSFIEGDFDVLVSTTIIESGLDVSNANTIFINNANNFGLSDLHQMRGRVGRSNKKAFCYFITPPYTTLTEEARKRIQALEQHTQLGSGFHIAMKDLEIRGAGDLLGGEQSGFINEIGFEAYQKIMNEAIEELKETEFKELYKIKDDDINYVKDIQIDTDFEILFPDNYINNVTERLFIYNELSKIKDLNTLHSFKEMLTDRFGKTPKQGEELLTSIQLKWKASEIGIEKLVLKNSKMLGYFVADSKSNYYNSLQFTKVLQFVQKNTKDCTFQEKQTKNGLRLVITFSNVNSINKALELLSYIN